MTARAALEFAETVASVTVQMEVTRSLRERLYRALVGARWETVAPLRGARLAHVFTTELERVSLTTHEMLSGALQLLIAVIYAGAAIAISPVLALVAAGGAVLLLLPARRQQRTARRDGDVLTVLGAELFVGATEEVATLKMAKSAGIASRVADRFSKRGRVHARALIMAHARYRAAAAFLTAGAAAALAVVVWVAVARMHLAPANLLLLLFVCARLVPRITSVQGSFLITARALPAAEAVQALLDELEGAAERAERAPSAPLEVRQAVELRDVTYRYPGAVAPALRDVSLSIPAGRVTAVVGSSGAGKSTLADVLLLLLTPERGGLFVDGTPVGDDLRDAWRASIGYVPQETHLFHDSVRENVRWVAPGRDRRATCSKRCAWRAPALSSRGCRAGSTRSSATAARCSRAASASGSRSRAPCSAGRACSCSTRRRARSTPRASASIRQTIASLTPAVTVLTITHRLTTARQADHVVVLDHGIDRRGGRLGGARATRGFTSRQPLGGAARSRRRRSCPRAPVRSS